VNLKLEYKYHLLMCVSYFNFDLLLNLPLSCQLAVAATHWLHPCGSGLYTLGSQWCPKTFIVDGNGTYRNIFYWLYQNFSCSQICNRTSK